MSSQLRTVALFAELSVRSAICCLFPLSGTFGKPDEREPLTNAVRSDSAVIGGKLFFVARSRKDISDSVLWRSAFQPILNDGHPAPSTPCYLQAHEPFHK